MLFPHHRPERLPLRAPGERWWRGPWLAQSARLALVTAGYLRALNVGGSMARVCARFFAVFNGPRGAEQLSCKASFGRIVQELGYRAPVTEVVPPALPPDVVLARLCARFPPDGPLFCKPADGFQGRGAALQPDRRAAAGFLSRRRVPYLAQSFERPVEDWRYVLHKDRPLLEGDPAGHAWRIAYLKVRPRVTGDGTSTVAALVAASPDIPSVARKKLMRKADPTLLAHVPGPGEEVEVVLTGNVTQGAYGRRPGAPALAGMDAFMLRFLRDLEERLGGVIATSCVDIGVLDPEALRHPADFERLRRSVVFYEFQVPFGLKGYRAQMPVPAPGSAPGTWLPAAVWQAYWRRKTVWRFYASVANSGRAHR